MRQLQVATVAGALALLAAYAAQGVARSSAGEVPLYTSAQATTGAADYQANCSRCHGTKLEGVSAPALRGSASGLGGDSVATAYTFISTQMPAGNPASLTAKQYSDILAFILKQNGHPAGSAALTPASAKKSQTKV